MRIGKWTVRVDGWHLVFEPVWGNRSGDITDDGQHVWTNAGPLSWDDLRKRYSPNAAHAFGACWHDAGPISWEDLRKHYSADDVKRWQDELGGHMGGL